PGRAPRADQRPLADPRRDRLYRTASTGLVARARPRRQPAERSADHQRPAQERARRIRDEPASPAGAARGPDRQGKAGVRRRHGVAGALGERACGWPFGEGHRNRPPRRHSASDEARGLRRAGGFCGMKEGVNRQEILDRLRENERALRERGVAHVALIGSRARGDNRADSDTDIMIEVDPTAHITVYDYVGLKEYIASLFEGPVDVVSRDGLKPYVGPAATADAVYAF